MTAVVVFGGGGFVGGAVLRALARDGAFAGIAAARRPPAPPTAFRLCDATDPAAVLRACEGATYAVNAVLADGASMLAATRAICAAAAAHKLLRVVHISTMSVYGAAEGVAREDAPLNPAGLGRYGRAKLECEDVVRGFATDGGEAVILRPGIVYGPGGRDWVGRIGRLLRARRLGDLGINGDGLCNLIFADDVGTATVAALRGTYAAGEAINLGPVTPPTWNEYFVALARAMGATPVRRVTARRLKLEGKLLAPPLEIAKRVAGKLGRRDGFAPDPIPPSLLGLWGQRLALDPAKADTLLGLSRTPFADGIAASAAWLGAAA